MKILFFIGIILLSIQTRANESVEQHCMAQNVYFEARGETTIGKFAIMKVTLNRVKDDRFPASICNVVKQRLKRKNGKVGCEFSWYCDGKSDKPKEVTEYNEILDFIKSIWYSIEIMDDPTKGAVFYHSTKIKGRWFKKNLTRTTKIGDHIFYK
jgi:spore germination cell wall hydrolase CwlJ-like protein